MCRAGEIAPQFRALTTLQTTKDQFPAPISSGSYPPVTPALGSMVSSSGLSRKLHPHMHTDPQMQTHIIRNKINILEVLIIH